MSHNENPTETDTTEDVAYDGFLCDDCVSFCVNCDLTALDEDEASFIEMADPDRYWVVGGKVGIMSTPCDRCGTPRQGNRYGGNAFS